MAEQPALNHIKTELSENQKEQNTTNDPNITSFHHQSRSNSKYVCSICSKVKVSCPCTYTTHTIPLLSHKMHNNNSYQNQRLYLNRSVQQNTSSSVPKITFTYAQAQPIRSRRNSWVHPASHQNTTYQLQSVVTTTVLSPVQQIIYYPVIHNRIKYQTPQKIVKLKAREGEGESKAYRSRRKSYLDYSSKLFKKDASTKESKQPMTPQQFRKLTDWLIQQK